MANRQADASFGVLGPLEVVREGHPLELGSPQLRVVVAALLVDANVVVSAAILFIVVIALAGLGFVVVKALGGEEVKLAAGTAIHLPERGVVRHHHDLVDQCLRDQQAVERIAMVPGQGLTLGSTAGRRSGTSR